MTIDQYPTRMDFAVHGVPVAREFNRGLKAWRNKRQRRKIAEIAFVCLAGLALAQVVFFEALVLLLK